MKMKTVFSWGREGFITLNEWLTRTETEFGNAATEPLDFYVTFIRISPLNSIQILLLGIEDKIKSHRFLIL